MNRFNKDNDQNNKTLSAIFAAFSPNVKTIRAKSDSPNGEKDVLDSRLKKVLLYLPYSVQNLHVGEGKNSRSIDMKDFREKNYFPNYNNVANMITDAVPDSKDLLFAKAKRILNDYSKHDSIFPSAALFFSGRWKLHHVDAVNKALDKSTTFAELYDAIKYDIKLVNPLGSLARRIRYIESLPEFNEWKADHPELENKNRKLPIL